MSSVSWIHGCTDKHAAPTNMMVVASAKKWVEEVLGEPAVIVIERVGERNRAALRVALRDGLAEVEVKSVYPLMRQRRSKTWQLESLMAIMEGLT